MVRTREEILEKAREEWPAVLAIFVLIGGHIGLAFVGGGMQPFGVPLIAAVVVFLIAEFGRRLWRT